MLHLHNGSCCLLTLGGFVKRCIFVLCSQWLFLCLVHSVKGQSSAVQ